MKSDSHTLKHAMTKAAMKFRFLLCLMALGPVWSFAGSPSPNVIFILVDDMGYYDLSCYGAEEVQTPRIDRLAEEGLRFTDFYAAAPICSPSRAGLLTGCYPRRVGNETWVHRPDSDSGLNPDELTMAELFRQNGYRTACIGKWHLGSREPFLPRNQGFDHYYGLLHNLDTYEAVHFENEGGVPLIRNGQVMERPADPARLTRLYTDEAIRWIESCTNNGQDDADPFFLYLPHTMFHHPIGVSGEFKGSSNWGEYGDAILEMDYHVGRLMDKLKELRIDGQTVVVFMSDNGRGPGRNPGQPIRGAKLTTLEGGLRVPCIAWGPGAGILQGAVTREVASAMDWFPSLASLAGINIPGEVIMDGRDLANLITGEADQVIFSLTGRALNAAVPLRRIWNPPLEWRRIIDREEYLNAFFYHGSQGALAAVRSGKWKLSLHPALQLYNLETDPGERKPLEDPDLKWKLRGMAVLFQEEMRLYSRPAGQMEIRQAEFNKIVGSN